MNNEAIFSQKDTFWMSKALSLATKASLSNEVPVGALITCDNKLVVETQNETIKNHDSTAHAEINAIRQAGLILKNYRLAECTLYTTLEPCCMCSGAIVNARFKRVVFGAFDKRLGASGSVFNILGDPRQYHQPTIQGGCLMDECELLLKNFFALKRGY